MKDESIDFLDGTIFNNKHFVVIIGKMIDCKSGYKQYGKKLGIPYDMMVDNGYEGVYDYYDFIYRWDVDGYYSFCEEDDMVISMLRNRLVRSLLDKRMFRETRLRKLAKLFGKNLLSSSGQIERQVGDFMIPIENSTKYFKWYDKNIGLYPMYMCPINFPTLSPFIKTAKRSIDFGVGYGVADPKQDRITLLRSCMLKAYELGGDTLKYNSIYKSQKEFWSFYNKELKKQYLTIKNKHDEHDRYYSVASKLTIK